MLKFGKQKVTHQDLAEALYNFAVDFTDLMANRDLGTAKLPYAGVDKQHFIHEWLIIMFWVIHRVPYECNKQHLMELILKTYFENCDLMRSKQTADTEQNLIIARFNEYDKAFNPSDGPRQFFLGGVVAKNILNQDKPVLAFTVSSTTATHVLLLMKEIKDICDKYKVVD